MYRLQSMNTRKYTHIGFLIYDEGIQGKDSKTSYMTFEGLGEMFEGDSADTCAEIFSLMSMGVRAEGLACADPATRTPIGVSGNYE